MRKIMFNDKFGLTKAVLEGRKIQTRRTMSDSTAMAVQNSVDFLITSNRTKDEIDKHLSKFGETISLYKIGDVVAIAQNYKDCGLTDESVKGCPGWRNKMFVKAELMPHRIQITGIKIERLQDISDEDCLKEGIYEDGGDDSYLPHYFYNYPGSNSDGFKTPRLAYTDLINKVAYTSIWDSNPWVLVYDFKLTR